MKRKAVLPLLAAAALAVFGACRGGSTEDADHHEPVRQVDCPGEVEASLLDQHSCFYVDLDDGSSIFVVRVEPPTPSDRSPIVALGQNLGSMPDYAGLAPVAQRTGRPALIVDLPGTAHSIPLLDCPEANALSAPAASDPAGTRRGVVGAVSECRKRLDGAGISVDDVSIADAATDLHEMIADLGLSKVVPLSVGSTGTVEVAWAQHHPDDLEALVLDTPLFTNPPLTERTDAIVAAVAGICAADAGCAKQYGDVKASWSSLTRSLRSRPLSVRAGSTEVHVDDTMLRRAVIWLGGRGQGGAGLVPSLIDEAAHRTNGGLLSQYASDLVRTPPYCAGYLPKCQLTTLAYGAALAYNCPAIADDPVWTDICAAWGTPAGEAFTDDVVAVPTLVLLGKYTGFTTLADTKDAFADVIPGAFYVESPTGAHNVLGQDCMRTIRTSWLNGDPTQAPADTSCMADLHLDFP